MAAPKSTVAGEIPPSDNVDSVRPQGPIPNVPVASDEVSYPEYLPQWDRSWHCEPDVPLENIFQPGALADPKKPNLIRPGVKVSHLSPSFGSVVEGIQLSSLDDSAKNELSLLVAERGVVVFRDQDLAELGPQGLVDYGRYFGPLYCFPIAKHVRGYPALHVIYRGPEEDYVTANYLATQLSRQSISSVAWHSDVTFEPNPPSTTFLLALDLPEKDGCLTGGDTLFASQTAAYKSLSPQFQKFLDGLYAFHSGVEQSAKIQDDGGHVSRKPITSTHPVVRVHPVTGEKAIFVNEGYTEYIVGLKKEESDTILRFLFDHYARSADIQVRVKWEPKQVVVWDNRTTVHSALHDFQTGKRRHVVRIAPMGERPIPVGGVS